MWEKLLDSLLDSLKIFPFLFLIYLIMELIENARKKETVERVLSGPFAPVFASALGAVPECGFAVMCAKLYEKGLIRIGTLIAAFISVSDEGVIVLATDGAPATEIILLMAIKMVYAVLIGELVNLLLAKKDAAHVCPNAGDCVECGEHHEKKIDKFFLHPLLHAVKTFLYVLILNVALGLIIYFVGEENFAVWAGRSYALQPLFASVVGLIPNCASSVFIAEAFLSGAIGFPALVAGLSANAGIGILLLLKSKTHYKKAILILAVMLVSSVTLGYAVTGITALF